MEFEKLEEAIRKIYELSSKEAIEGVKVGDCGPFGAGILEVADGKYKILTIAHNTAVRSKDPTCHAEINAIRQACKIKDTNDLSGCILVTTAKSCPMCLSASIWANIKEIYYSEDYEDATTAGFRDNAIAEYIQGKNDLIKEIQIKDERCLEPFIEWNNNENKIKY